MSLARTIHATCVATDKGAVLLLGPSGSGKSDLALRLIDRGAVLISDDRVVVRREDDRLVAEAPGAMFGNMEVRGVGICNVPAQREATILLIVHLGEEGARLPDASTETLDGITLPLLRLDPHRASAPLKIEMALTHGVGST